MADELGSKARQLLRTTAVEFSTGCQLNILYGYKFGSRFNRHIKSSPFDHECNQFRLEQRIVISLELLMLVIKAVKAREDLINLEAVHQEHCKLLRLCDGDGYLLTHFAWFRMQGEKVLIPTGVIEFDRNRFLIEARAMKQKLDNHLNGL